MPYKDPEKQRVFQNKWMAKRRTEYVTKRGPCDCGATEGLKLILKRNAPGNGLGAHVFSYTEKYRERALRKYDVKCKRCYDEIHNQRMSERHMGTKGVPFSLSPADVWAIRGRLLSSESMRMIAKDFDIQHQTVQSIRDGITYAWLRRRAGRKVYGIDIEAKP